MNKALNNAGIPNETQVGSEILRKPKSKHPNNNTALPDLQKRVSCQQLTTRNRGTERAQSDDMAGNWGRNDNMDCQMIGNAPVIENESESNFPDKYKLEIYRLRRRVADLESTLMDKNDRVVKAIQILESEAAMFRQIIYDDVRETYGQIKQRMIKIDGALQELKHKGSRYYPPLEIPEAWQKKTESKRNKT